MLLRGGKKCTRDKDGWEYVLDRRFKKICGGIIMFADRKRICLMLLVVLSFTMLFLMGCEPDPIFYTLTMEKGGQGTLEPPVGSYSYEQGTQKDVKAEPSEGWEFIEWIGPVTDTKSPETSILIDEDTTLKAVFKVIESYIIEFEDEYLEEAIREAIGKMEGDLFLEDVIELESLDAIGRGIVSIEGIEYLYNLKILNLAMDGQTLDANYIEDINPLENLIHLQELYLAGNEVSDINPLNNLIDLEELDLFLNQVDQIQVLENLVKLKRLDLSRNQFDDLTALENLTDLESLRFHENEVTDISALANLTELTLLDMSRNQIEDISPLEDLINLETLFMNRNQLEAIGVLENLVNLEDLRFSANQVADISVLENLTNLTSLFIPYNEISDISSLVANIGLGSGTLIDIRYNYLDLSEGSDDKEDIDILIQREAIVRYEPQRDP